LTGSFGGDSRFLAHGAHRFADFPEVLPLLPD
jgi:hypothetical protein